MDRRLGVITFINCFGVKLATKVQNVFTVAKLVVIAIIIAGGFYMIGKGEYFILYIFTLIDTFVIKWKRNYYFQAILST